MNHIIALTGYSGVGKDTLANHLVENHGYVRVAFADKIRELLYETNPIVFRGEDDSVERLMDIVKYYGWDKAKRIFPEIRFLMQNFGEGAKKVLGERVWIDPVLRAINETDKNVVVSDLRFPEEAEALNWTWNKKSGFVARVTRPGVGMVNDHRSETFDIRWHHHVDLSLYAFSSMEFAADRLHEAACNWYG